MSLEVINKKIYINNKEIAVLKNNSNRDVYWFNENISFSEIEFLIDDDFPNEIFLHGMLEEFYFGIEKKEGSCIITFTYFLADPREWIEEITFNDFADIFKNILKETKTYNIKVYEDQVEEITFNVEIHNKCTLGNFYKDLIIFYDTQKKLILSSNKVSKVINFSSEHLTAGSSILQYFGKLLEEKYPNENVSVSIKQEGLKVTLVIENIDGKKEEIEEYLNRYGMVITNQITASEFTSNPIQILELEKKLESAKMEIGFQKKLLALQDKTYDVNLVSLKDEVNFLRKELSSLRTNNNEQIKLLLSSLLSKDKLIKKLTKSIDKKDEQETKQLLLELKNKDNDGYISLKQHIDTAVIGGIVNAPSWIQFTIGIISKL